MSIKHFITNYQAYNQWATVNLLNWLKEQDVNLIYKKTSSSYETIEETIQHSMLATKYWLGFISGISSKGFKWSMDKGNIAQTIEAYKQTLIDFESHIKGYLEEELMEVLHLDTPWAKNSLARYEYIVHAINHATYHRGQIVTMARELNITEGIPNTDYNMFRSIV